MMKTMKKVISVLLSVLIITSMLPVTAYAVEGTAYEIGEEFSVDQSGETDSFYGHILPKLKRCISTQPRITKQE